MKRPNTLAHRRSTVGSLVILSLLLWALPASAQISTGTIFGKVSDNEGRPLPGVAVVLSGPQMAPLSTLTTSAGIYRFPAVPPGGLYRITAEIKGFKTVTRGPVGVTIAANAEIDLVLEPGKIEEQIVVTAASPVIDPKKTTIASSFDKSALQSLPTARDPWVVLQMAPAVLVDRENVGGSESGQQPYFLARGDMGNNGYFGANNLFILDGVDITDPAALGASPTYYDFDSFDELNITTGGAADVTIQTGGVALNMVTRRGGNRVSLAGRFYLTDSGFQSNNLTQSLRDQGILGTNKIQQIKDYGFNFGGPLVRDRLWFWGAYGVQDIFLYSIYGTKDQTLLNNYTFKLNAQLLGSNRFEASLKTGQKEKLGMASSSANPYGVHRTDLRHWGSPIMMLQDEQVFGNSLYLSLKLSYNDVGFALRPMTDEDLAMPLVYDYAAKTYVAFGYGFGASSYSAYQDVRPRANYQLNANYFNDTFLGLSHEVKIGAEYSRKSHDTRDGNFQGYDIYRNFGTAALDTDQDGRRTAAEMVDSGWQRISWYRNTHRIGLADQFAAYLQDTVTKGDFTFTLGLRVDRQVPSMGAVDVSAGMASAANPGPWSIFDPAVRARMDEILPGVHADALGGNPYVLNGEDRSYRWDTWSPRLGLTWNITGDGKYLLKIALAQYGDVMGTASYAASPVGLDGRAYFWWMDGGYGRRADLTWGRLGSPDGRVTLDELFWAHNGTQPAGTRYVPYAVFDGSGAINAVTLADLAANGYDSDPYLAGLIQGYEWNNKTALDYTDVTWWAMDRKAQSSSRTREALLTLERELAPDLSASVTAIYRRYDRFESWLSFFPESRYRDEFDPAGLALSGLVIDPLAPPAEGSWYVEAGRIPRSFVIMYPTNPDGSAVYPWAGAGETIYSTGEAGDRPFYLPARYYPVSYSPYSIVRKSDAFTNYTGLDLALNKRLSNRWFANVSVTLQRQENHARGEYFDPTNKWVVDGQPFAQWGGGGAGKVAVAMYTRWMVKLSALYQLPFGFNVSATANAREGWKIPHFFWMSLNPDSVPNPYYTDTSVYTQNVVEDSLPVLLNVTLRLEKRIDIGAGRLYLMADAFNLFNAATVNRAYEAYLGDTYWDGAPGNQIDNFYYSNCRRLNEVLNPRVVRFGVRFEF